MTRETGGVDFVVAGPSHAPVFARVHAGAIEPAWSEDAFATLFSQPGTVGWIALVDERPAGILLARAVADEAEILTLAVLPEDRRRGLACGLMGALLDWATDEAVVRVFLEVAEGNAAARGLYDRFGFEIAGRRMDYYGIDDHALMLVRSA
jgi:ribosomal-protein-alanine N-acetyltransferase